MNESKRITFLGLPLHVGVDRETVCRLLDDAGAMRMVTFINPWAWELAAKNSSYAPMLEQMTLVLPDGEGVARACRALMHENSRRISFDMTSLAAPFFRTLADHAKSLIIVGGKPGVDEAVAAKLRTRFQGLNILDSAHGYGDFAQKISGIMAKSPDAVIVGMGAPRQEAFLLALRDAGYKGLAITCGGFFDQYLISDNYYPEWIDHLDLRFLYRMYKEPRRLWRRYLIGYQPFIARVIKAGFSTPAVRQATQALRRVARKIVPHGAVPQPPV